jgi:hypothetical protein
MVGAGVLFGGKSIVDLRSQRRQRARQRLKVTLRKSVDDVQFRVGNELGEALRAAQRYLRDELSARIEEVHRTTTETIERLDRVTSTDSTERERRRTELEARLRRLDELAQGPASTLTPTPTQGSSQSSPGAGRPGSAATAADSTPGAPS